MPNDKDERKKDRSSKRSGGRKDERTISRSSSLRNVRSHEDSHSVSERGMHRSGSARSLRTSVKSLSGKEDDKLSRGSDHKKKGGDDRSTGIKPPLERQTSNNQDSMTMLLGLAGKKGPRKRSDSDSSASSSSASSKSARRGPPITGEKTKPKVAKDGPLIRRAAGDRVDEAKKAATASGDSEVVNRAATTDDGSVAASDYNPTASSKKTAPQKFMEEDDTSFVALNLSRLSFPTVEPARTASQGEKNAFVSRPDLRKVDQSINLMDVNAGTKAGKPSLIDVPKDLSTLSVTSNSSSYSRGSFSRNQKNPYLKVSPWEKFTYAVKTFFRDLSKILCNKVCILAMVTIIVLAIALPLVLSKKKVIKSSKLLVPLGGSTSDSRMAHPIIDTIELEGIKFLAPVFSGEEADQRLERIAKILSEHGLTSFQEDRCAKEGLKWIAEYDPAKMSLESDEGALLQRYALAVFFFATNLGTMANRTTSQALSGGSNNEFTAKESHAGRRRIDSYGANWMIDGNICNWQGVECEGNSRVVYLNRSKTTLQGSLPAELALLKELSVLDLSRNYLEGTVPEIFVERLKKLQYLLLQDNLLTGSLPSRLGEWVSLTNMNLGQNKFSGHVPSFLGTLTNFEFLFLQENLLSGSIPSLEGMRSLKYLHMNNNDFTGTIPAGLFKDKSLVEVRLGYNRFVGPLPAEIHKVHGLEMLSVGNNRLNGTIPDVFQHISKLLALDIHKNALSGSIPKSLGTLTNLEHLLLDNNELTGTLAPELFQMKKIKTFVLHHNKLKGVIPSMIDSLTSLQDLWLNHNEFTGTIPSELGGCTKLVNLYLQDNAFSGTFPSTFHTLERLRTFRAFHNNITGVISEAFCNLSEAFNLSFIAADCEMLVKCSCCHTCY